MADVLVTWQTQVQQNPPGSPKPDHFHIGLGVLEADEPLTATSHLFTGIAPGDYQGHGEVVAADGTELQPPMLFNVSVPSNPPVDVPMIVTIGGQVQ